jgi:hypothetical protein
MAQARRTKTIVKRSEGRKSDQQMYAEVMRDQILTGKTTKITERRESERLVIDVEEDDNETLSDRTGQVGQGR